MNDHTNYSAADIEAYWQGRLNARTMHAMEKAALDDPFLADAMEGYRLQWESEKESAAYHLNDLATRLETRISGKQRKNRIAWWKPAVAASVLVIAGTYAWLYWQRARQPEFSTSEVAVVTDTARTIDVPGVVDSIKPPGEPTVALHERRKETKRANATVQQQHNEEIAVIKAAPAAAQPAAKISVDTIAIKEIADAATEKAFTGINNAPIASISGVVRGEDAAPVSGALLQLNNKVSGVQTTAITNEKGEYTLHYRPQADSAEIRVNVVGYAQAAKSVSRSDSNAIINFNLMPSQNALGEVVVVGYGSQKKKANEGAAPSGGWDNFRKYLSDSARVPEALSHIHGDVEVEFDINTAGKISSFEIENSLHPTLDQEAIRLIKEGPAWENKRRKTTRVRTSVRF
ncbi:MAG: carboxypeptidase-like regulatory domain-containing protein [Flavihumibacter sp.]